ncbi:hypothetical protein [Novosphingobium ginsenosidimutans]|nr:hypothetical protein [Novosphingobium ginsenosidimutans]
MAIMAAVLADIGSLQFLFATLFQQEWPLGKRGGFSILAAIANDAVQH